MTTPTPQDLQLAADITSGKHGWWPCKPHALAEHLTRVREEGFTRAREDRAELTAAVKASTATLLENNATMDAAAATIQELKALVAQYEAALQRVDKLIATSQAKGLGQICHFTIRDLQAALAGP